MDRQIGGLKAGLALLYNGIVIVWTMVSALSYGFAAMVVALFSKKAARSVARLWCLQLLFITGVKLKIEGIDNIDGSKSYIFVANHQGYFDIPVLYAGLGSTLSFIAKTELFRIPFFGWGMSAVGCINLNRKNPRRARLSITRAVSVLKKNNISLALFPEGTRSASGSVGEFKRGSFTLALEAGVPVVPVAICGTRKIHRKGSFRISPATVRLVVGAPIFPQSERLDKEQLAAMTREIIVTIVEGRKI
jgi:1-acyl-sn-glycerol-3-phosphate acyltransferase